MSHAAAGSIRSTMPCYTAQQAAIKILSDPLTDAYSLRLVTAHNNHTKRS